jgi:hypothetical protein
MRSQLTTSCSRARAADGRQRRGDVGGLVASSSVASRDFELAQYANYTTCGDRDGN